MNGGKTVRKWGEGEVKGGREVGKAGGREEMRESENGGIHVPVKEKKKD